MEASENTPDIERSPAEVAALIAEGAQLIDVRQDYEFEAARISGASRIGLEILAENHDAVDSSRPIVFYCRTGARSDMAAQAFASAGVDAVSLTGGIYAWIEDGQPIEPEDGYVAEPGQAAAILQAKERARS
ncbi:MAG: rhodanese-like domain-containing protein [Solirubrobacterales bacterium]